ncbi:MAG TPA: GNAT family N-acetyltransferase [Spirochaetia bacterium]|nr:GNAT family N-acetyltransferase [Spirochaetia bacterium]
MNVVKIGFRSTVTERDLQLVREITDSTGFFYPEEVDTAVELVEDRLAKGPRCGYHFLFAEQEGETVGYTSFGPIACTRESYDLYWIVVSGTYRGKGLGTQLLEQSEEAIASFGGTRVYIETSARPLYEPTRAFYLARGYTQIAELEDFYAPGDAKAMYLKVMPRRARE